jgi:Tol biopolymer transport system component
MAAVYKAYQAGNGGIFFTPNRDGKREVYRTDQSGEVVRITYTPGHGKSWSPAWAWRGNYTAFVSDRDGPQEIYALLAGGVLQRISHTPGGKWSWEPAW